MGVKANDVIKVMQSWIGADKRQIIDLYNSYKPLARGYAVKYTDAWCDTTVSACFIKLGAVGLIGGTECGVEKHIELFKKAGIWNEDGSVTPTPGAIICYNWDTAAQPNDGYADHIGVVEKISGKNITVIEGNFDNAVKRRTIPVGWGYIRGYAFPKYEPEAGTSSKNSPGVTSEKQGRTATAVPSKMNLSKPIIDVSEWQGVIDWEKAKSQIGGAILRVAYGAKKNDDYITRNLSECSRLGIPFGVYIYSLAYSESMAKEEASIALAAIKGYTPSLPIYIDLEENRYGYIAKTVAKAFCEAVGAAGYKFGIYASESYFKNFIDGVNLTGYSPWIARYGTNDGTKQLNNKPTLAMDGWQYTSKGAVGGISGNVDMSEFYTDFSGSSTPSETTSQPSSPTTSKTVEELAKEVIASKWGNGADRISRLTAAGYDANAVQKKVNELLGASTSVTYSVKSGDTLSSIAAKYGVSYLKIAADNKISNPNLIHVGQKLVINR